MIREKGLGELGTFVLILLVGVIFLTSATLFYGDVFTNAGVTSFTNINETTGASEAYSDIQSNLGQLGGDLVNGTVTEESSAAQVLFTSAFSGILTVWTLLGAGVTIITGSLTTLALAFGIPITILQVITVIIALFVTWRILEVILGRSV